MTPNLMFSKSTNTSLYNKVRLLTFDPQKNPLKNMKITENWKKK